MPYGYNTSTYEKALLRNFVQKRENVYPISHDISFFIADLKYKKGEVKICEFGEGTRSRYKGHDTMHGQGTMWTFVWDYFKHLDITPCYIGHLRTNYWRQDIAYKDFCKIKSYHAPNFACFKQSPYFQQKKYRRKHKKKKFRNFKDFDGALMCRHFDASALKFQQFRRQNPNFLVLNTAIAPYVNNKYFTDMLFQDPEFAQYKPKFIICKKKYDKNLAKKIHETINSKHYVIKPLSNFKGRGIIIVEKNLLDITLQRILLHKKHKKLRKHKKYMNELYEYWDKHKSNPEPFLVEEYCASKHITRHGKKYDATMRAVFMLDYNNGKINITHFDAFWKIPLKSLSDNACITEILKSKGTIPEPVSDEDMQDLRKVLNKFMPKLYKKMITIINERKAFA